MRKLERMPAFGLSLETRDDACVRPPHEFQRHRLLSRLLRETADDLHALDALAPRFAPGGARDLPEDMRSAVLTDEQITEDWQLPFMEAMAATAARAGGDVLEVGFGRGRFDAVFLHTYALDEDESVEPLARSVTFAARFFPTAAEHLRRGGVFTYLTGEIDALGRSHQRLLFEHFGGIRLPRVALSVPADVRDAWWADSMVVVEATR